MTKRQKRNTDVLRLVAFLLLPPHRLFAAEEGQRSTPSSFFHSHFGGGQRFSGGGQTVKPQPHNLRQFLPWENAATVFEHNMQKERERNWKDLIRLWFRLRIQNTKVVRPRSNKLRCFFVQWNFKKVKAFKNTKNWSFFYKKIPKDLQPSLQREL